MRIIISAPIHRFFLGLCLVSACDAGDITPDQSDREAPIGCGGVDELECPAGLECIDASGGVCRPETQGPDCVGLCEPIDGLCGGVFQLACAEGWVCHDLADECDPKLGHTDCLGGCRPLELADKPLSKIEPEPEPAPLPEGLCGGPAGVECEEGWICHDLADDCVPSRGDSDCLGGCRPAEPGPDPIPNVEPEPEPDLSCGVDGKQCDEDQFCADKLDDACDPKKDHIDCPGVCRPIEAPPVQSPAQCGGVGGLTCPKKQACVDDPSDECDPDAGDIDCLGTCQERPAKRRYVSHDREECAVAVFVCRLGEKPFFEEHGCGCEKQ